MRKNATMLNRNYSINRKKEKEQDCSSNSGKKECKQLTESDDKKKGRSIEKLAKNPKKSEQNDAQKTRGNRKLYNTNLSPIKSPLKGDKPKPLTAEKSKSSTAVKSKSSTADRRPKSSTADKSKSSTADRRPKSSTTDKSKSSTADKSKTSTADKSKVVTKFRSSSNNKKKKEDRIESKRDNDGSIETDIRESEMSRNQQSE